MKKWILSLSALLLTLSAAADGRSSELLARLKETVGAMPGYRVDFAVEAEGKTFSGFYQVRGESYYMALGEAEVYCDGQVRREVDPSKREVVVDRVDLSSRNILNNPTRAFSLLDGSFAHETLSEEGGVATLLLVPSAPEAGISRLTIELDTHTRLPRRMIYDADGEPVAILIRSFRPDSSPLKLFDAGNYPSFELIDFR